MRTITIQQPRKVIIGAGCLSQLCDDYLQQGLKRLFILTAPPIRPLIAEAVRTLESKGVAVEIYDNIRQEPTVSDFYAVLGIAQEFGADGIAGIGGGSVMDTAKLIAAFADGKQRVEDCFGTGFVKGRSLWLGCMPTTAGTGSEVSPNAILLDEADKLKKGIVSPYLMADAAYLDAALTVTVPAKVTAETGMDALTHCIEAYTNKFAHPVIDLYAREGIRLISHHLLQAVKDGTDMEAREALLRGSYYGGICLGPVNTAAVHALSYPLGGEFHISHGLANAILLPSVMVFNKDSNPQKFAEIARLCEAGDTAEDSIRYVSRLSKACGIPTRLSDIGIPQSAVPHLAEAAMEVTRLLNNNPRPVTLADATHIYESLF
ncbi:MAG: iron-containing alcohol dehydrogenase [Mediterranea sp.]|jgi:alcohol dehydrogenase class IV|nr:iron-containing alcohol dehydrogenase [Mediterranea sp.]